MDRNRSSSSSFNILLYSYVKKFPPSSLYLFIYLGKTVIHSLSDNDLYSISIYTRMNWNLLMFIFSSFFSFFCFHYWCSVYQSRLYTYQTGRCYSECWSFITQSAWTKNIHNSILMFTAFSNNGLLSFILSSCISIKWYAYAVLYALHFAYMWMYVKWNCGHIYHMDWLFHKIHYIRIIIVRGRFSFSVLDLSERNVA